MQTKTTVFKRRPLHANIDTLFKQISPFIVSKTTTASTDHIMQVKTKTSKQRPIYPSEDHSVQDSKTTLCKQTQRHAVLKWRPSRSSAKYHPFGVQATIFKWRPNHTTQIPSTQAKTPLLKVHRPLYAGISLFTRRPCRLFKWRPNHVSNDTLCSRDYPPCSSFKGHYARTDHFNQAKTKSCNQRPLYSGGDNCVCSKTALGS